MRHFAALPKGCELDGRRNGLKALFFIKEFIAQAGNRLFISKIIFGAFGLFLSKKYLTKGNRNYFISLKSMMQNNSENLNNLLSAIQDTLRKIDRLNSTIQLLKQQTPDDLLTLNSYESFKLRLTEDLAAMLANFELNVKVESIAA